MPERNHYKQPKDSKLMKAYVELGVNVMSEFGASKEDAVKAMEDILDLEIQLANVITIFGV